MGAVLISRSQPKILRKIQKKIAVIYHRYHPLFACMSHIHRTLLSHLMTLVCLLSDVFFVCVFIHNDSQQLSMVLFCCRICFCLNSCPYPHPWDYVIPFSTARKEKMTNNAERQSAIINDYQRPPLIGNN